MSDGVHSQACNGGVPAAGDATAGGDSTEELLVVVGEVGGDSLQDRFLRFRKERQLERALAKKLALSPAAPLGAARDPDALRARFVEACRGYLGVPYSQKSHSPEEPDYHAPLFLDCCGLVRRAVRDLEQDFGFRIGPWNQAYQFETLPVELTFEQLRPGDLIFAEGVYYEQGRKPQRHNIVHVEVFIGGADGVEATIGSRWSKSDPAEGKVRGVQIHPSYRYVSKKYEISRFHFRSLDTWLRGECRSLSYPDASAGAAAVAPSFGGKSIFEGQGASDAEEEAGDFSPDPFGASPVFYVGEGNNWKVVADALEQRGWRRLPFTAGFTNRFDLKWVEQRAKIDYRRHLEGQLVNHIPNNDVLTSKAKFLDTVRAQEAATGSRFLWHPASYSTARYAEKLAALAAAEAEPEAAWILKPSRGLGGKGIELVRGAAALRRFLFPEMPGPHPSDAADQGDPDPTPVGPPPLEGWVVQRYLEDPLLLQGRKFDLRAYCLVARTTPHLWFFHPGYCKAALDPYDPADLGGRYAHLTNASVQKTHPRYGEEFRGRHIWSEAEAEAELLATGRWTAEQAALAWLFRASVGALERRRGYFDLLGVDFMLDANLGLHLLEVNSNPAIFFDSSPTLEELVPRLIGSTLDAVLAAHREQTPPLELGGQAKPPLSAPPPGSAFQPLVDEAAGFVCGGP